MKIITKQIIIIAIIGLISGCGIYKFNATSISPDVKTISVHTIENRAMKVNPALSNLLTEALQDKYRKLTKLTPKQEDGDLDVQGIIVSYDITPTAVTSDEVASLNRLTITVQISFKNNKDPEESWEKKSFAAFKDYDSNKTIEQVEAQLCNEIVEILVEDIFNATVANW